ncbi:MAG TPA: protocatechuate 3,4-dioxygenase [Usitatibacteraceae bacterium]|nr:protocatechuate 3,4-dioxygenase [Usitatibacteraceae bacterium]
MRAPTPFIPDVHLHGEAGHHTPAAGISRRRIISGAATVAGAAFVAGPLGALAQAIPGRLPMTPLQTIGPFYPIDVPADQDADMTVLGASKERAQGTVIYVSGRVLDVNGVPVANATLDIWQCNAAGRYAHPADSNKAPLDAHFQGFARIRTVADGSYKFKSIKPGAYPTGDGDWMRPPHIHFDVRGQKSRAITQMYFEGEPLNAKDRLLNAIRNKDSVIAKIDAATGAAEKGALNVRWDVVLLAG